MGHQRNSEQHASLLDPETADLVAAILGGLATPSRLRIIAALQAGPLTVNEITAAVEMEQSAVSHQLRHLRDLRFVISQRQGRSVIYELFDDHVTELISQGLAHAEHIRLDDPDAPRLRTDRRASDQFGAGRAKARTQPIERPQP